MIWEKKACIIFKQSLNDHYDQKILLTTNFDRPFTQDSKTCFGIVQLHWEVG